MIKHIVVTGVVALLGFTGTAQAALIGVDFGGPAPTNWTAGTGGPNPQILPNLIDETGFVTAVSLSYTGDAFSNTGLVPFTANPALIPTHANPLANISGGMNDADGITFTYTGLEANTPYKLWLFGAQNTVADTYHDVTITGSGAPVLFTQNPANPGDLFVNGLIGSNALLDSFAVLAFSSNTGVLRIRVDDASPGFNDQPVVTIAGLAIERAAVPEPGAAFLVGVGLVAIRLIRRSRR